MSIASMIEKCISMVIGKDTCMVDIEEMARQCGINTENMDKVEMVRAIQQTQGNEPCYGTSDGQCDHSDCCFMADCLQMDR
jgi:hypothetical protein